MTAHTHTSFTPGCYRCDIGADELTTPPDFTLSDRTVALVARTPVDCADNADQIAYLLAVEVQYHRAARDELLLWLVEELAYPFNFYTDNPVPVAWRHLLADAWADRDGDGTPEDADAIRAFVAEEGRWA